jgi:hypothetical protein
MNTSQDILCPILCVSAAVCLKLHASFSRSLSRNAQNNFPNKPLLVSGVLPTHAYHHHLAPREHHIVCRLAYTPRIAWTVHVTRPIILSGPIHYTSFLSKKKKIVHIQVVWCFARWTGRGWKLYASRRHVDVSRPVRVISDAHTVHRIITLSGPSRANPQHARTRV